MPNNYNNIPAELKAIRAWIVWRAEDIGASKLSKIPFQLNGQKASVTNPEHWSSFDDVVAASSNYSGIGFVFSSGDPYTFLDLDATTDPTVLSHQQEIFKTFVSYSELSPSGQGLHIIVKGNVPQGRRRNAIEIYSNERYATFTGNVYLNEPIRECQAELTALWESLGNEKAAVLNFESQPETISDAEVIRIASEAANGNKFQALYSGEYGGLYPSQSEADFSLINMIGFYTKNKAQIARIFKTSALGKREKAKRGPYIMDMINGAFDRELPPIDIDALKIEVEKEIRESSLKVKPSPHKTLDEGSTPSSLTNQNGYLNAVQEQRKSFSSEQKTLSSEQSSISSSQQKENSGSENLVSGIQTNSQMHPLPGEPSGSFGLSSFRPGFERGSVGSNGGVGLEQGTDFKGSGEVYSSMRELSSQTSLGGKEQLNPAAPTTYNVNANAGSFNGRTAPFDGANEGSNPSPVANLPTVTKTKSNVEVPPGLLGEIAQFIYQAAPRPVPEIAIAAAIGLMAGICGRAYNVSSTGLNQYVLLLAMTGRGKEGIQSGISKLIAAVRQQVPSIEECIGPDEIASGPALYKYLNKNPGFVSVLSEFGLRLASMSDGHGNGANVSLRRMILQLYAKSGFNDVAHPSIYSDKDKNIAAIPSPAFSILGESTPHTFYRNLNEEMISEGLLPRFLLIEYAGERVPHNKSHALAKPSNELIDKLAQIAANAATVENSQPRRVITVNFSPEAFKISEDYSAQCDRFINNKSNNEVVIELWNRAHLKVLKLAAIVSVGINMWNPTIEREHLEWAIGMVNADIKTLSEKFESGKIGANTQEIKQIDEVTRVIKEYAKCEWKDVVKYCSAKDKLLHADKVIPYGYISRRLIAVAAFRADKMGATFSLQRTLKILLDRDHLQELSRDQLKQRFGTTQKSYMISNTKLLENEEGE